MAYDAFISYSHTADQRLAEALERGLEGFARPWNKRRALDIFRDEGNLNLSDHLWGSIQRALSTSRFFLYLASPQSAQSPWVSREINFWKTQRNREHFIILWTHGVLVWDNEIRAFDPHQSTAAAAELRGMFEGEPFYLDLRWTRDETDLTLRNDRFRKQVVQLAATIRGVAVEDLAGQEAEQFRRTIRIRNLALVVLAALTVSASVAAGTAILARRAAVRSEARAQDAAAIAETQRKEAETARSRAVLSEAQANERAAEAARQKTLADEQARAAQIALAQASTQEGRRLMDVGRTGEALAHFARALRADHESSAVNWVSSILANSRLWVPGLPLRHRAQVRSAAFSPDGHRVITGSMDGTARVWDSLTGLPVGAPLQHQQGVSSVAFSPDGTWILTVAGSTAHLWDAHTGAPRATLHHRSPIRAAQFSPDGQHVVTASSDASAAVWETTTGHVLVGPFKHDEPVHDASFSPDGRLVVTAGADGVARVWDAVTGAQVGPALRHRSDVYTARFSPDSRLIVTGSADRTAQLWDVKTSTAIGKPIQHAGFLAVAKFSPDGRRILTASYDGTARLWFTTTQNPASDTLEHGAGVYAAEFSKDGAYVLTASGDGTARLWDGITGVPVAPPLQHRDELATATLSPDGSTICTASTDTTARLWHATARASGSFVLPHDGVVDDAVFSEDGRWVATVSSNRTAGVWNAKTGLLRTLIRADADSKSFFRSIGLSRDGRLIITSPAATLSAGGASSPLDVWDAVTGRLVRRSTQEAPLIWASAFSPDRHRFIAGGTVMDVATRTPVLTLVPGERRVSSGYSSDGRTIVTAAQNEVRFWNAHTGASIGSPLHQGDDVYSLALSPDGRRLATGGTDDSARLWDVRNHEPLGVRMQSRDRRRQVVINVAVAFSDDGRRIATASDYGYARVWDAFSGAPLTPLLSHQFGVYHARFSADGRRLVTASLDRTARIWTVVIGDGAPLSAALLADAAELVGGFSLSESGAPIPLDMLAQQRRLSSLKGTQSTSPDLASLANQLLAVSHVSVLPSH